MTANTNPNPNRNAEAETRPQPDAESAPESEREAEAEARIPTPVPSDVPADERPAATCQYCGRPFRRERRYWIHLGESHPEAINEAERNAHEQAVNEEGDDLFIYHLKVIAWLVILLFFYIYTYALVWSPVY
jgi:hypothetical protein